MLVFGGWFKESTCLPCYSIGGMGFRSTCCTRTKGHSSSVFRYCRTPSSVDSLRRENGLTTKRQVDSQATISSHSRHEEDEGLLISHFYLPRRIGFNTKCLGGDVASRRKGIRQQCTGDFYKRGEYGTNTGGGGIQRDTSKQDVDASPHHRTGNDVVDVFGIADMPMLERTNQSLRL